MTNPVGGTILFDGAEVPIADVRAVARLRRTRPRLVDQCESDAGQFWYKVRGGNGSNLLTSETYPTRSNAIRAARAYIASVDPVPVRFTYWTGAVPPVGQSGDFAAVKKVTERIR